jgi:hypothetical protein
MIFFATAFFFLFRIKLKRFVAESCFAVVVLVIALTSFAANTARINQSEVDDKIWQRIESTSASPLRVVVTFNPYVNYPMPPYHSLAESDFHADWGIGGYISWHSNNKVEIFKNFTCNTTDGDASCIGDYYYGGSKVYNSEVLSSTIFVYSDYVINPTELDSNAIRVSNSYNDFRKFVTSTCGNVACKS